VASVVRWGELQSWGGTTTAWSAVRGAMADGSDWSISWCLRLRGPASVWSVELGSGALRARVNSHATFDGWLRLTSPTLCGRDHLRVVRGSRWRGLWQWLVNFVVSALARACVGLVCCVGLRGTAGESQLARHIRWLASINITHALWEGPPPRGPWLAVAWLIAVAGQFRGVCACAGLRRVGPLSWAQGHCGRESTRTPHSMAGFD
jgi:hypothetical protein